MSRKKSDNSFQGFTKLLSAYLKQELAMPVKALVRWAIFGFLGSIFIAVASIYFLIGIIRVLQTETGTIFQGNLSWAPYFIAVAVLLVLGFLILKIIKGRGKEEVKNVS